MEFALIHDLFGFLQDLACRGLSATGRQYAVGRRFGFHIGVKDLHRQFVAATSLSFAQVHSEIHLRLDGFHHAEAGYFAAGRVRDRYFDVGALQEWRELQADVDAAAIRPRVCIQGADADLGGQQGGFTGVGEKDVGGQGCAIIAEG